MIRFGSEEAAHLLRRTAFCAPKDAVERAVARGMDVTLDELFASPSEPEFDAIDSSVRDSDDLDLLASAWLHRLVGSRAPLRERMALFFHNHFVSGLAKVRSGSMMLGQIALFRRHAFGSFPELALEVSRDPAMIRYLDLESSTRTQPNENYARELMELFTMGPGPYGEADIQEAARAFTGHRLRAHRFHFAPAAHDDGVKQLLGQRGRFAAKEVTTLCCNHPATARFMARKLAREFLSDTPDAESIDFIAESWTRHEGQLGAILRELFRWPGFYAPQHRFARTRGPVEFAVALQRALGLQLPPLAVARQLPGMGRTLLDPPGVKGYEGGRSWLNATTLLARRAFSCGLGPHEAGRALRSSCEQKSPEERLDFLASRLSLAFTPQEKRLLLARTESVGDLLALVSCHPRLQRS